MFVWATTYFDVNFIFRLVSFLYVCVMRGKETNEINRWLDWTLVLNLSL